jgi:hypothetical protein
MKKIMMIAAMMVAAVTANAQNEVGQITLQPKVGLNIASATGDIKIGNETFDKKSKAGFVAGVEAEYGLAEKVGLVAGILYSQQGAKFSKSYNAAGIAVGEYKYTASLDYIKIPILVQYYVIPGLAIKAGIQPGFNVRKKVSGDSSLSADIMNTLTNEEKAQANKYLSDETAAIDKKFKDDLKAFDFSIPVGISYEYQSFVLDARYNIGLTKVVKDFNCKNSVFQITLGYKFAL